VQAGRASRDRHELHRFHPERIVDVLPNSTIRRPPFPGNRRRGAPAIASSAAIEYHLDVVLTGEPGPDVVVEARMIPGDDQQMTDRSPDG